MEGKITITVQEVGDCPLFIGNIYGGGNFSDYTPVDINNGSTEYTEYTPVIKVLRATVGGTSPLDEYNHPLLPVINPGFQLPANEYEGNVYGGGYYGNVTSNPIVIIGDKDHPDDSPVNIEGNVYGGGKIGTVNGNTKVIIMPTE